MLPSQWSEVWTTVRDTLQIPADEACKDPARLYYFPTVPPDGAIVTCDNAGETFSPGAHGRKLPRAKATGGGIEIAPAPENPAEENGPKNFGVIEPVDLFEIRRQLRAVRKAESARIARVVIAGEPLDLPPGRDVTMNKACSVLATACTPPLVWASALEILRPSLNATPQERAGHLEHWIKECEDMFNRALQRRLKADAKSAELKGALMKALGMSKEPKGGVISEEDATNWRAGLLVTLDKEGAPAGVKQVGANAGLILQHDERWAKNLRFNEVTKEIDVLGGPMPVVSKNSFDVELANWLSRSEFHLNLNTKQVSEQMLAVARRNAYDPLAHWLKEEIRWDGVNRLESFFTRYFGATGDPRYLAQIGKSWLIAAVARALQPGCKVDNVLVLQGLQGKKKSTALQILGGAFFSDTKFDIHDKDGRMMASRFWIIELAELASMRKADVEALKGFFSARRDDIRVPYGRVLESFPRRCVFVGSTNSEEFLPGDDQQRRYWPVRINVIDTDALTTDRDQLWAEATARFLAGERWWLEGEDVALAEVEAQSVSRSSPYTEPILNWWLKLSHRPDTVTTSQVASEALSMLTSQATGGVRQEIGMALRAMGFDRVKKRLGGIPVNAYRAPQELLDATKNTTAQILSAVKSKGA